MLEEEMEAWCLGVDIRRLARLDLEVLEGDDERDDEHQTSAQFSHGRPAWFLKLQRVISRREGKPSIQQ